MLQDKDTLPQPEPVDQPAARRRSRIYYGWYLLATAIVISIAASGVRDGFHVLIFPMREELQLSMAAVAVAMAIGQLMSGVTQPIIGHLFDRFDSRRVILICVVATGLATAGLYWTSHYWHLIFLFSCVLSVVMGGASLAILWPLAARWFVKRLGLALGLLTAGLSMGSMVWTPRRSLFHFLEHLAGRLACAERHLLVPGPACGPEVSAQLAVGHGTEARRRPGNTDGGTEQGEQARAPTRPVRGGSMAAGVSVPDDLGLVAGVGDWRLQRFGDFSICAVRL